MMKIEKYNIDTKHTVYATFFFFAYPDNILWDISPLLFDNTIIAFDCYVSLFSFNQFLSLSLSFMILCVYVCVWVHTCSIWKFLGQGLNRSCSFYLRHSCNNVTSFKPLCRVVDGTFSSTATQAPQSDSYFCVFFFSFFFCFLGPHPLHMEFPRLRVQLQLQQPHGS